MLIKEAVEYFEKLNEIKKTAYPYFPLGFTDFSQKAVVSGLLNEKMLYLAVWSLGCKEIKIPLGSKILKVKVGYPLFEKTEYSRDEKELTVYFNENCQARFFEIELEKDLKY